MHLSLCPAVTCQRMDFRASCGMSRSSKQSAGHSLKGKCSSSTEERMLLSRGRNRYGRQNRSGGKGASTFARPCGMDPAVEPHSRQLVLRFLPRRDDRSGLGLVAVRGCSSSPSPPPNCASGTCRTRVTTGQTASEKEPASSTQLRRISGFPVLCTGTAGRTPMLWIQCYACLLQLPQLTTALQLRSHRLWNAKVGLLSIQEWSPRATTSSSSTCARSARSSARSSASSPTCATACPRWSATPGEPPVRNVANIHLRLDGQGERLDRIEHRLELAG